LRRATAPPDARVARGAAMNGVTSMRAPPTTAARAATIAALVARYEEAGALVRDALDAANERAGDGASAAAIVARAREGKREVEARRRAERTTARATATREREVTCPRCARALAARRFAWHLERCLRANAA